MRPRSRLWLAGLSSVLAGVGCASPQRHADLPGPSRVSEPPEEVDEQYRLGMSAFARGDWDAARKALLNFASRECHAPERAVCRPVEIDIARAQMRAGHPAAAFIGFDLLLARASGDERPSLTGERDAAWAAMKAAWAKSPGKQPVEIRFREQASGFEAESAELFIDGQKVFAAQLPRMKGEAVSVPLTSLALDTGEHVFGGRVHFNDRSRARFTVKIRGPVPVMEGPVVVEILSSDTTTASLGMAIPTLDLSVHQASAESVISPP